MVEEEIIVPVPTPKPFVQAACFCEKVLREHDNVPSLIRMIDTYHLDPLPSPLPANITPVLTSTVFVALKAGDVTGEHTIGLRLTKPSGATGALREWRTMFSGDENGVNLQISFEIPKPEIGLYWFDVVWEDGEVLTRIPLRVKLKTTASPDESNETVRMPSQATS